MKKFLINILSPIIVPVLVGLIIYTDVYAGSILGITQGGTGLSNIPQGTILYGSSTDQQLNSLNIGTSGKVLTSDGSIPNWASSSVAWGLITGTLSSQTDLQNALDTKLSTSSAGSTYVPYTGAINNLNLGTFDISAATSSLTKLIVSGTSTFPGGIWQGAGNVGIGTTTPAYGLDVETGSIKINNNITGAGSSGKIYLGDGSFTKNFGSAWSFAGGLTTSNAFSQTTSASTNSFAGVTNFTHTPISLTTSGNVGIGTTTPNQILSVVGNGLFSGSLAASNLLGTWQGYNPVDFLASTTPYTPTSRTLTINGTTYDLTANRSWTVAGGSGATTTINGVDGPTFTFATSSDTNIGLTIATSSGQLLFTPTWIGTLADARITNSSNWNTAYSDRLKWDGGATDLVAATGRTSLGLGTIATFTSTDYLASTTPWKGWTDFSNTATGLTYNNTTGATSLTSGYNIPLIASTSNWNGFWDTPSTRITAGTNLSWSGNTLNATGGSGGGLATTSPFTSGYIPYATSTGALTDSPIFNWNGNIGIGTTTPSSLLSINYNDEDILVWSQDFEGATFVPTEQDWSTGHEGATSTDWIATTSVYYAGSKSAQSGSVVDGSYSWIDVNFYATSSGVLSFYWKVSSESDYDFISVYLNDDSFSSSPYTQISGDVDWVQVNIPISTGDNSIRWIYSKDSSSFDGSDMGFLDNVSFSFSITKHNLLRLLSSGTDLMTFNSAGSLSFGGYYGSTGQVLISAGTSSPTHWGTIAALQAGANFYTGYVPYISSANQLSGSLLYAGNSTIQIGTSTVSSPFSFYVSGISGFENQTFFGDMYSENGDVLGINNNDIIFRGDAGTLTYSTSSVDYTMLYSDEHEIALDPYGEYGAVSIGSFIHDYGSKLAVNGNINIGTTTSYFAGITAIGDTSSDFGAFYWNQDSWGYANNKFVNDLENSAYIGLGGSDSGGSFFDNMTYLDDYAGGLNLRSNYGDISLFASTSVKLIIKNGGNVGIGTTTPLTRLQVLNGVATTSLAIGSAYSGLNKGCISIWNGSNYTRITFGANSITPIYSTSTLATCL